MYGSDSDAIRSRQKTRIRMYQAVEAERTRPGCLLRLAEWAGIYLYSTNRVKVLEALMSAGIVVNEDL
jgi:hypothetical protein